MKNRENDQPGAPAHAEGEHGERTSEGNRERIQHRLDEDADIEVGEPLKTHRRDGGRRIYEDRQQHDEADKNSDKDHIRHDREKGRTNDQRGRVGQK